jgi:hypothetical protein
MIWHGLTSPAAHNGLAAGSSPAGPAAASELLADTDIKGTLLLGVIRSTDSSTDIREQVLQSRDCVLSASMAPVTSCEEKGYRQPRRLLLSDPL